MEETQKSIEKPNKTNEIKALIANAAHIAIIPSKIAGVDAFSAACGLYRALKGADKQVSFIYTGKVPDGCTALISQDELTSDVFERELVVSIDYSETPAARVHYSTENDILYLKVKPIDKNFNLSRVNAQIKGFNFDLVITVGATSLEDLGQVYTELKDSFSSSSILNIDNTGLNKSYGKINVIDTSIDSLSLLILGKLVEWGYPLSQKAAKSLLTGITSRNPD
jgi:nanoRNase/pAp phosphatase (c-di-AMP/oligoRNAs hydrolase)